MSDLGELRVRKWNGEEWPDKRVSIANDDGALFINARYLDDAESKAIQIVNCVNCHDGLLEALKQITQHYCQLIESGDCGFWDPETDSCVIKARYYISQSEGNPQ